MAESVKIASDTSPVVERFLRYKLVVQGRSPKTVEEYRIDLHTFFVIWLRRVREFLLLTKAFMRFLFLM